MIISAFAFDGFFLPIHPVIPVAEDTTMMNIKFEICLILG